MPAGFYAGKSVLVTGGLGFIGSNVARRLVDLNAKVRILDSAAPNTGASYANLSGYRERVDLHVASLADLADRSELVEGQDVIFNLAGNVSHVDSMEDPLSDLEANVRAQLIFLETCRRQAPRARIVFASTRQIYGRPRYLPVDESHGLDPTDVNGINKMAGEAYHSLYHKVFGLACVSLRLTNVFGPRMRVSDGRLTFLGIWLRRVVEQREFEIWGGQQKRDLTYVDDAVDAFLAAGSPGVAAGQIYNIGGCAPISLLDLGQLLVSVAGRGGFSVKPFPEERQKIEIGDYFADDARFRSATGWEPRVSLGEGLRRSVEFYQGCLNEYV